jgi:hypothetical protein
MESSLFNNLDDHWPAGVMFSGPVTPMNAKPAEAETGQKSNQTVFAGSQAPDRRKDVTKGETGQ